MPLNLILRQNFSENAKVDSTLVSIKLFSNFQPLCDFNGSGTIPPGFNRGFFSVVEVNFLPDSCDLIT